MNGVDAAAGWAGAGVVRWLESGGAAFVQWVGVMNMWLAALLVVVVLADRLLERRVSAGWRIALYAVIAVRLALPLGWTSPIGLVGGEAATTPLAAGPASGEIPVLRDIPVVGQLFAMPATRSAELLPAPVAPPVTWRALVLPLYALGALLLAGVLGWRLRAARRVVRAAHAVDAEPSAIRLHVHPTAGPVLVGIVRPTLVVPEALARGGAEALAAVVAHERAHIRRGDHLAAPALAWATVLLWPLAAVWIAVARIRTLMEQAADELALRGAASAERAAYGRALVEIARRARRAAAIDRLSPAPALGFCGDLEARVRALANTRRWGGAWQAGVIAVAASAMIACAGSRPAAPGGDEPAVPARLQGAIKAPAPGAPRIVRITVLPGVPTHAKLPEPRMQQSEELAKDRQAQAEGPRTVATLSAQETHDIVRAAREQGLPEMMTPDTRVTPGGDARVGTQELTGVFMHGEMIPCDLTTEFQISAAPAPGGDANSVVITLAYRETDRATGKDSVWASLDNVIVPHGRSVWVRAHGEKGAPMRLLLVTAGSAPDGAAQVDPGDKTAYPLASTMVWIMEMTTPASFETLLPGALKGERSGRAEFAGDGATTAVRVNDAAGTKAGAWACALPRSRLSELGDALTKAGAKHVASPALIAKAGQPVTVAPGSADKAHASTGPHGITLAGSLAQGDAMVLDGVQWFAMPDGATRRACTFEGVRLEHGDVLAVMQPPMTPGGAWTVTVYNPSIVAELAQYPFQTANGLGEQQAAPADGPATKELEQQRRGVPMPPRP